MPTAFFVRDSNDSDEPYRNLTLAEIEDEEFLEKFQIMSEDSPVRLPLEDYVFNRQEHLELMDDYRELLRPQAVNPNGNVGSNALVEYFKATQEFNNELSEPSPEMLIPIYRHSSRRYPDDATTMYLRMKRTNSNRETHTHTDGGKMVRITRQEYENPDAVEGLPENIVAAINMWRVTTQGDRAERVAAVAEECGLGLYQAMFLQKLGQLPNPDQYENWVNTWNQRLDRVNDRDFRSLVIELIQNAMDIDAGSIRISFEGEDEVVFQHTGNPWQVDELAAVDQFFSTKRGDISSIGQFGVGLKYWWHHFEQFEVRYYDQNIVHKIVYSHGFNPTECYYESEDGPQQHNELTEFAFRGLKNGMPEEMVNKFSDYRDADAPLLSGRVKDSMPNLMPIDRGEFSLSISTLNPPRTDVYQVQQENVFHPLEIDDEFEPCVHGYWSSVDGGDEPIRILTFRIHVNQLPAQINDGYRGYFNRMLQRYRGWVKREYEHFANDNEDEEEVERKINEMFENFVISFHYNPVTRMGFQAKCSLPQNKRSGLAFSLSMDLGS